MTGVGDGDQQGDSAPIGTVQHRVKSLGREWGFEAVEFIDSESDRVEFQETGASLLEESRSSGKRCWRKSVWKR